MYYLNARSDFCALLWHANLILSMVTLNHTAKEEYIITPWCLMFWGWQLSSGSKWFCSQPRLLLLLLVKLLMTCWSWRGTIYMELPWKWWGLNDCIYNSHTQSHLQNMIYCYVHHSNILFVYHTGQTYVV